MSSTGRAAPDGAVACSCSAAGTHDPLLDMLTVVKGRGSRHCAWDLLTAANDPEGLSALACVTADSAMRLRCQGAGAIYAVWRDAINARVTLAGTERSRLVPFIRTAFGLPERPGNDIHRRGWLAEFVWFAVASGLGGASGRRLRRLEPPSFHATEPGGDGLAVWQNADGSLHFRLWEVKQHTGTTPVGPTVSGAFRQVAEKAPEYLAKLTGIAAAAEAQDGADVGRLYGELSDHWVYGTNVCGVGVALATSEVLLPRRCFSKMHTYFPALTSEGQLEGMVAGISDFALFADDVRDRVWTAL